MIAYLLAKLDMWINDASERDREAYLAAARNLADIEQRMCHLERAP